METPDFLEGVAEAERLLAARRIVPALDTHLTCVIGSHATDGGERIPGIGLVCPDHLNALAAAVAARVSVRRRHAVDDLYPLRLDA